MGSPLEPVKRQTDTLIQEVEYAWRAVAFEKV